MKQSEINFIENNSRCVMVQFEGIEFYWERSTPEVLVSGKSYDQTIWLKSGYESTAKEARAAIIKFIDYAFGV